MKTEVHETCAKLVKTPQYADWPRMMKRLPPIRLFGSYVVVVQVAILSHTVRAYKEIPAPGAYD
jgi:hypothetical protein